MRRIVIRVCILYIEKSETMKEETNKPSFMIRLATWIVDKRKLFFLIYGAAALFSVFSQSWVKVNDDLTTYLPQETETRQGLDIMDAEFTTFATARIMVNNITYTMADDLVASLENISGVSEVDFDDTKDHYQGASALYEVTFDGEVEDDISLEALGEVKKVLAPYDTYISTEVGNNRSDLLAEEMKTIIVIAAVIIVSVLLLTSKAYMEIPVLLLTFIAAAVLNMGTNYWFGEISFISNSVTVVLQLALAIDYAIILCHRYGEERTHMEPREAVITALSKAIPEISASSLTTISGLAALMFMQFDIGFDMGRVLIKAILFSLLSVFTLMPGLLLLFSKGIDRTHHRNFVPSIDGIGHIVVKLQYIVPPIFVILLIVGYKFSSMCPYAYGYTQITSFQKSEQTIATDKIEEIFGGQNVLAVVVPKGDYDKERAMLADLEKHQEVSSALGIANAEAMDDYMLADALTPRQMAEMMEMDVEFAKLMYTAYGIKNEAYGYVLGNLDEYAVPLIDMLLFAHDEVDKGYLELDDEMQDDLDDAYDKIVDAQKQLQGENYSRVVLDLNIPEEGEETFAFLDTLRADVERYYDDYYLVGNTTSDFDLSTSFSRDNVMITVLSIVFVVLVLLFTFKSIGLPLLLIMVIQGSVWINFSMPYLQQSYLFFLSYLVVSSIQMGANIDYAIVISSRYMELKKQMPIHKAVITALNQAFPTIITSGSMLASAGLLIGFMSSDPTVASIGICLGRGTILSIFLVMFVLPEILMLGDTIIERTRFDIKPPENTKEIEGAVRVSGHIRGEVHGMIDAEIHGVIHGAVHATIDTKGKDEYQARLPKPKEEVTPEEAAEEKEAQTDETTI